jgi:hypothetical protein
VINLPVAALTLRPAVVLSPKASASASAFEIPRGERDQPPAVTV